MDFRCTARDGREMFYHIGTLYWAKAHDRVLGLWKSYGTRLYDPLSNKVYTCGEDSWNIGRMTQM